MFNLSLPDSPMKKTDTWSHK